MFDLQRAERDGVILGVARSGKPTVALGQADTWVEIEGPLLPLREWLMLTLAVESGQPARLYLNGRLVGEVASSPVLGPTAEHKLTIGRNIIVSCIVGTYLLYGVIPLVGTARTLASAGVFAVGGVAQVVLFQIQKHSDE